jgi:hypothetical protein
MKIKDMDGERPGKKALKKSASLKYIDGSGNNVH